MATLVLRTVKGSPLTNLEVDNNFSNINVEVANAFGRANLVSSNVGILASLTTANTSNIVFAINEVLQRATSNVNVTAGNISNVALANVRVVSGNVSNIILDVRPVNDTATATTCFITFVTSNTSNSQVRITDSRLQFVPSTGLLSTTDYNSTSDITLKENITPIDNALDIVTQLQGFGFTWKDNGEKGYALSAQDVEAILPEVVRTRPDGLKGINYLNFIALLIEAVKELSTTVQQLRNNK